MTLSGADGEFVLKRVNWEKPVLVKASGFRRTQTNLAREEPVRISLEPFDAKGVYLSYYGVRSDTVRGRVLQLIENTSINAVVIDVKPDEGTLSFQWSIPLAEKIGSMSRPTIDDPEEFIAELHAKGIYVIGRISVFKDNLLASKRPEWTIQSVKTGSPYAERDKMAWMDPFRTEVWDYNISVAKAAAEAGFDEVQFDYVRFPVNTGPTVATYRKEYSAVNRGEAIVGFLKKAYQELLPYNVFVAADVFGITCWYDDESGIGQPLREMSKWADYVCPMVYPSGFTTGFMNTDEKPVAIPREVILWSMQKALPIVNGQHKKLRPWLQNFKDYAYDRRQFTDREIALQIFASDEANTSGWLLWDAGNKYNHTAEALQLLETGSVSNLLNKPLIAEQKVSQ
ncbi:MAG: putative glycoside hydrolase [Verrucomicrobia bacterium]|nr:putative glycoside hydrolase [Verrucomicrobiota bacterium]